jgi:hypothetical protein
MVNTSKIFASGPQRKYHYELKKSSAVKRLGKFTRSSFLELANGLGFLCTSSAVSKLPIVTPVWQAVQNKIYNIFINRDFFSLRASTAKYLVLRIPVGAANPNVNSDSSSHSFYRYAVP